MFTKLFGNEATQERAQASASGYGQRARSLFEGAGAQAQALHGQAAAAASRAAGSVGSLQAQGFQTQGAAGFGSMKAKALEMKERAFHTAQGVPPTASQRLGQASSFDDERSGMLYGGAAHGGVGHYNDLPAITRDHLDSTALQAAGFGALGPALARRKREAYDMLFVMSNPIRMQVLLALRELVKDVATEDPEMPLWASSRVESLVDGLWGDVVLHTEVMVADAAQPGIASLDHARLADHGAHPAPLTPFWIRARTLYHYIPFDKSVFGNLKDPVWWLFTLLTLLPVFGIRIAFFSIVLAMLLRGCPADEFQLVSFILNLKATQFVASGVFMAVAATVQYYGCVHSDLVHTCDSSGPGAEEAVWPGAVDFFGDLILAWVAFLCLPCSRNLTSARDLSVDDEADYLSDGGTSSDGEQSSARRWRLCRCLSRWDSNRGGRLFGLLLYDLLSFLTCLVVMGVLSNIDNSHARQGGRPTDMGQWQSIFSLEGIEKAVTIDLQSWEFKQTFYLTRMFYSLLMFPYVVFTFPYMATILTHTAPTGFNLQGVCVPHTLPPRPEKKGN